MKLWLIRHAKSDWSSGAVRDFDRPLNWRGERDGPRMAGWLADQDAAATWIWSSSALRARATARFVADGFAAVRPTVMEDRRLYDASPESLLEVVRETPPEHTAAAVVAHNPGITYLANLLAGSDLTDNVPTFGVLRFDIASAWHELGYGQARLDLSISPKGLPS